MKHFEPSLTPAEGLGALVLFQLIEEAVPAFFRADRRIFIARAPGRLDVMGGFADLSGSLVLQLPTAEAACTAAQLRDDDQVRLWSPCRDGSRTQLLTTRLPDMGLPGHPIEYAEVRKLLGSDPHDQWAGYLLGALLVLARERGLRPHHGFDLLVHSDVPEGSGAGSSSAVTVAAMRAFALACGIELAGRELALLGQRVETEVFGRPTSSKDAMTAACGEADELLVMRCQPCELEPGLAVPQELEFVGLDSGVRDGSAAVVDPAWRGQADENARAERFRELLKPRLTVSSRQELGELMFASHAAYSESGLGHATTDFLVQQARVRMAAGGQVLGAKVTGRGRGGTVVLLGERGKVWYEALRIKKALLQHTGHSAHIFRWSSPGAMSFGSIELRPVGG